MNIFLQKEENNLYRLMYVNRFNLKDFFCWYDIGVKILELKYCESTMHELKNKYYRYDFYGEEGQAQNFHPWNSIYFETEQQGQEFIDNELYPIVLMRKLCNEEYF